MIVVDAAAVVDALTLAPDTDRLRDRLLTEDLHAPTLLDYEIVSALRGQARAGRLSAPRAEAALEEVAVWPVQRWDSALELRRRTFSLRHTVSADEAAYVALAEALDCPLVTRDGRLARSHGHAVPILVY